MLEVLGIIFLIFIAVKVFEDWKRLDAKQEDGVSRMNRPDIALINEQIKRLESENPHYERCGYRHNSYKLPDYILMFKTKNKVSVMTLTKEDYHQRTKKVVDDLVKSGELESYIYIEWTTAFLKNEGLETLETYVQRYGKKYIDAGTVGYKS
jgi:hypothetical protein